MFGLKQMFNLNPGNLIVKKSDSKYFWYYHNSTGQYNLLDRSSEENHKRNALNEALFFLRIFYINNSKYLEFLSGTNIVILGTWMDVWESFNREWENISDTK
jgi:hypothetical protein